MRMHVRMHACACVYICMWVHNKCDRISENSSKSHMKSSKYYISTYVYVFPEYLLHNFNNLSIKFHVMKLCTKCNSVHATVINIMK